MFCETTGLTTKNETSETTVRNLYCLFPYIYNSLELYSVHMFLSLTEDLVRPLDFTILRVLDFLGDPVLSQPNFMNSER